MKAARREVVPVTLPEPAREPFALWAGLVFLVALAVRVAHVLQIRGATFFTVLFGDGRGYDTWARQLADGDWVGREVFYQAPLYPYFLGAIYALLGRDLLIVRLVQAVVGSAACVLLALAAWRLFASRRAGLVAGLGLALYAPAIFFDGLIQKSVLDVFFVCLSLWLMSRIITGPGRPRMWLGLGLALGGLSLTRENALALVAVAVAWALLRSDPAAPRVAVKGRHSARGGALAKRVANAGALAAGLALVLLPVAVRNNAVGGGFFVTTSQFGPNFYIGNNPGADGTYASLRFGRGSPEYERQDATELAEVASGRRLTPAEVSSYWTGRALDFITTSPGAWLRLLWRKFVLLWNSTEMLDTESQETYAEWSSVLRVLGWVGHFGVLVPLALAGVWLTWPDRRRLWVLHAMLASYAATVLMFYVFARYRFPMVPFLMLFAAAGITSSVALVRSDRRASAARPGGGRLQLAAAGALMFSVVFTNWPVLSTAVMQAVTENNIGTALQDEGRLDDALAHYRRALELSPDYVPAFNNMGTALRAQGQLDRAIATYEEAIALRPDYPDAHYNLANALLEKDQPERAAEHFRRALRTIPGSAHVHNNLGIALANEGRLDEAVAQFREAVKADPDSAMAYRNLGDALASRGQVAEGIAALRRAVELAPKDGVLRYDLGSVLLEAGRAVDAEVEFRQSLTLRPDSADAHNNLGIALGSQGRLEEAVDQFQRALTIDPQFADAQRNLTIAREARGQR
jgi:tetratricopeptide (TPR) repeat protein